MASLEEEILCSLHRKIAARLDLYITWCPSYFGGSSRAMTISTLADTIRHAREGRRKCLPVDVLVAGERVEVHINAMSKPQWSYLLCDPDVFDNVIRKINELLPVETNDERQPLSDT